MAKATFKCLICGNTTEVFFDGGNCPTPICCDKDMIRQWFNVSPGDIVSEDMIKIGHMMKHASLPSGKDANS